MTGTPSPSHCGCRWATQVVVCRCSQAGLLPSDATAEIEAALAEMDVDLAVVDDLCALAANRDPRLAALCSTKQLHVVACFPRAVRWLLHAAGVEVDTKELSVHNLRSKAAHEVFADLETSICRDEETIVSRIDYQEEWAPWFPVIDRERCDSCGQCASFCIFGVYRATEDGAVEVVQPLSCKNNCPACARICPRGAIVFPKIAESPLNGDEISDESLLAANVQLSIAKLLGDDPRAALAARRAKAQRRLLREDALAKARAERCAHAEEIPQSPPTNKVPPTCKPCCREQAQ